MYHTINLLEHSVKLYYYFILKYIFTAISMNMVYDLQLCMYIYIVQNYNTLRVPYLFKFF